MSEDRVRFFLQNFEKEHKHTLRPIVETVAQRLREEKISVKNAKFEDVRRLMWEARFAKIYCEKNIARVFYLLTGRTHNRAKTSKK